MNDEEVWYVVEFSRIGEGDWFTFNDRTYDSLHGALEAMQRWIKQVRDDDENEYRIVKKTLASKVVSGAYAKKEAK